MAVSENAFDQVVTENYSIYNGDSCLLMRNIPDNSIHMSIYSPPFEGLFRFSNSLNDVSNSSGKDFYDHYGVIISENLRITKPGRICAVHVMQLPTTKGREGFIGMRDFRGEVIREHIARGWQFVSEICIWKDPVTAQQRTKSIRLLHKQLKKDSTLSGQGLADYIVVFRKPGENDTPVDGMFDQWCGSEPREGSDGSHDARTPYGIDISREAYDRHCANMSAGQAAWPYDTWVSVRVWQRVASPVWMDINQTRTLQYRGGRDPSDIAHISPLQLDVVERAIDLWSNPGEVIFTPFLGIGTECWAAVNMGRKGLGIELKPSYFKQAIKNLETAGKSSEALFDENNNEDEA